MLKKICGIVCLFLALEARADLYEISGISVSSTQDSAVAARDVALADGQLEAFHRLIIKLAGEDALSQIPAQTPESVDAFVQDVSIERENSTSTRYSGQITVRFKPEMINDLLKHQEVEYLTQEPPSLLVIPVFQKGNKQYILDEANPLYQTLRQLGNFAPFYKAELPLGDAGEVLLTERALGAELDLSSLEPLLQVYHKDRLLILRLREEETEGTMLIDSSIWPDQGMTSQAVFKRFRSPSGDMEEAVAQMVEVIFGTMTKNWRTAYSSSSDNERVIYARIPVSSLEEWLAIEKEMAGWNFMDSTIARGAYLPQMLVEFSFSKDRSEIVRELAERGWALSMDFSGLGATLTRGVSFE